MMKQNHTILIKKVFVKLKKKCL